MPNLDYLIVDRFLQTALDAQALHYALQIGLIRRLEAERCSTLQIPVGSPIGRQMIVDLLAANDVVQLCDDQVSLTGSFRTALQFRDLLEAKLAFANEVAKDLGQHFGLLIDNVPSFMENSATFRLFRYDRCFEATPENVTLARQWMRYTTALTRYEGRVLAQSVDLSSAREVLDVGGNSGELALQLCAAFPALSATVFDLPVVCAVGREHVANYAARDRIAFAPGDVRRDRLPSNKDVVCLKSVLHDWPANDAAGLLRAAAQALGPNGQIVIFERAAFRAHGRLSYADLTNLVFFPFFRPADLYLDVLATLGFRDITHRTVRLEMDFHLITATRP